MIAGKPKDEIDEMIYALREICPDVGIIRKNGKIIMTGNGIMRVKKTVKILSGIERIESINKYGTRCILEMKGDEAIIMNVASNERSEELCVIA
ncbi:MAG: hypothetical protein WC788_02870 [Candidatus Paceibacterota bacterium]|jgi:hypothetical protein